MNFKELLRTKSDHTEVDVSESLRRCLSTTDLTVLGIGAIIGAGIFVLTGIAAATKAGPAIMLSYMLAGLASAFSALAYAELASSIGGCGSAYGYSYVGLGEIVAWIIGWDLLLEYSVSCSTVAIGWSSYANDFLQAMGFHIPSLLLHTPFHGGVINILAFSIVIFITILLAIGVKEGARFNEIIVVIKLIAISIFVYVAVGHVNFTNWQPFMPFGWHGVVNGAALIFFAYIGFDAVSTTAEEAINPQKSLPRGIIFSLAICTFIYILVSGLLTAVAPYASLNVSSPVANVLLRLGQSFAAGLVAVGAIAGLTTVILVMYYGLTRIMLAMTRDGLLPNILAHVNRRTKTPLRVIISCGIVIALIAGLAPIEDVAQLVNIGTLAAFCLVCAGVIILRYTKPDLPRPFKISFGPLIPSLGIIFCVYLMVHLNAFTWLRFVIWMAVGLLVYFFYSRKKSLLALKEVR